MAVCLVGWFVCQAAWHGNSSVIPVAWRYTSEEQIAAEIRRRPIGAVIADICRDLGITGSHQLWRELHWAITYQGGDYVRLVSDIIARTGRRIAKAWPAAAPPPSPAAAGTGPP